MAERAQEAARHQERMEEAMRKPQPLTAPTPRGKENSLVTPTKASTRPVVPSSPLVSPGMARLPLSSIASIVEAKVAAGLMSPVEERRAAVFSYEEESDSPLEKGYRYGSIDWDGGVGGGGMKSPVRPLMMR